MEYPNKYDKPVRYSEEFLKELASNCLGANLVKEKHHGEMIGRVSNLTFTDGALWADVSTDEALDDLKYSPSYDSTLVDNGDHWLATDGKLLEVALTSNPRKAILNNTGDKGGSSMADNNNDGTIEFFQNEVKRLQKENNKLDFQLNQANDKINGFEEKEAELKELREWKETNEKVIEEQKPIIEAYKKEKAEEREELLEKASQGNAEIKEQLKNCDNDALKAIANLHTTEQPAQGVGASNAPGLNEGDGETDEEAEQKERQEAVEGMFGDLFKEE
jgi:hypothetical protein